MGDLSARNAFAQYPEVDAGDAVSRTIIIVIALKPGSAEIRPGTPFWEEMGAAGVKVEFLKNPCRLHLLDGWPQEIAEVEAMHCFGQWMQEKVSGEPVAGAIAISHLRALQQARKSHGQARLIIVIEEDVKPATNAVPHMLTFIAAWFGN